MSAVRPQETLPNKPALSQDDVESRHADLLTLKRSYLAFVDDLRGREGVDQRWLAIGLTDVEKGIMSVQYALLDVPMKKALEKLKALAAELKG